MSDDSQPTVSERILGGGGAASIAVACTNPFDVVKVRLQLERQRGGSSGALPVLRNIVAAEGPGSLTKGTGFAMLRGLTYGGLRLGMYEPASSGAGGAASLLQGVRRDGVRSLWTGTAPSMQRSAVLTASQLATYDQIKQLLARHTGASPAALPTMLTASMLAGLVTTTTTSPFDVVKTRAMAAASGGQAGGVLQGGTSAAMAAIVRSEGFAGLLRGWLPNYLRQGPQTLLLLILNDRLTSGLTERRRAAL
ncbi:hypothetical protein EMIHUDRAFT_243559 [Emiliania huxleyi CCMP1516]|uniref:Uncharacterized protein n=2 Tax=Emiliania huxleyi TaxID=2903 RepID=A0A0D3J5C7_EMIH1|nr:mitochondrial carrier family [Emiliania huxleyi CCMP1516]XP_005771141.1 hypothetical protein EMIHUDRAFT_243559 [Emiliania huxleyi CCMP1516]EOD05909.1 mitochondrial carrier family [Emiliania huxleyi CCMP1516]EOD18712.1 hypothetical protein EMIHUDRAFT_243559 [Emiliania huxleyi CCMP1516]|eukprot:XP_005758338.1 mitochondrial carrier family [Emiliania huxleyi CCMP1516]